MKTFTFSFKKAIFSGAVITALFLFLSTCCFAEDLPGKKEAPPTGYVEEPVTEVEQTTQISENLFFHLDTDVFYTYSDASDSDPLNGYGISAMVAPTYKFAKSAFLSLVYDGSYVKERELYAADSGYMLRAENQHHTITPILRMDFGENDRYSIKPHVFFTVDLNKDTDHADWNDGLYNYKDLGGGIDFKMRDLGWSDAEGVMTLGFQLYEREYPNYTSLLDLAAGLNTETDEKDYLGLILNAEYEWTKEMGLSWAVEYSLLIKWLDDKKVVDLNGVLTSQEQEDYLHMLETRFWYFFKSGFRVGLDLEANMQESNQNYYEGFGGAGATVATEDYYDYCSYRITPSLSFQFRIIPLTLFASFSYQELEYDDREAKNSAGDGYIGDKQYEKEKSSTIGARYSFNENFSLICQWEHVDVSSNNRYEEVYKYNYWTDAYSIGISYKF